MKTILFVFVLIGLCTANDYNEYNQQNSQEQSQKAKAFRSGNEYVYVYNGQIASGLDVSGPNNAPSPADEPQQKAITRIQAQAKIAFESDQRAILRLDQVRFGQLNDEIQSPQQIQPMRMFERKEMEKDNQQELELPLKFEYNNGVVENIQFHSEDSTWSKNLKRGVLNLIQINLKSQPTRDGQSSMGESAEQQFDQQENNRRSQYKTFALSEMTIEGECETIYSISKNRKYSNDYQQSAEFDEEKQQQSDRSFNVTKTINFKKCSQIADVAFGFQTQQLQFQCARCKLHQQQSYGPQHQSPCRQECDPKEVKEQKLDRTTVLRFVLNGNPQEYGIKRAELVSQYTYKNFKAENIPYSSMQTVVAAELVYKSSHQKQNEAQGFRSESQKRTLLFDNRWNIETKRFYMHGDEESNSPFAKVANKVNQALNITRQLSQATSDKLRGIESSDVYELQQLVKLLRMCSLSELEQIYSQIANSHHSQSNVHQSKMEKIMADALAISGTRNTIQVLVKKIKESKLTPEQAVESLKQLNGLPAPSDKQVDIILQLCQEKYTNQNKNLKQACWLTFGSMVGELCRHKTSKGEKSQNVFGVQSGFNDQEQCSRSKKVQYQQALMEEFNQAGSIYEQVLALKALGNAGIDTSVQFLESIITNRRESHHVRVQAIDSLRRLRGQMSRKIQRVLLPIFQNTFEDSTVRMASFVMIMKTNPDQSILDQAIFSLAKERNPQVQSLVYTTLKAITQSKIPEHKQMVEHLKSTLKLVNVDEQSLKGSRYYSIPIFSDEQKEGVFVNLASVFGKQNNILPNHMALMIDTLLNDEFESNTLKLSMTQAGIEQWYEGIKQSVLNAQRQSNGMSRAQQRSPNSREEELRRIFQGLKMKKRQSTYQQYSNENDEEQQQRRSRNRQQSKKQQPFAVMSVRMGDVDTTILMLDRDSMPRCLKSLINGQQLSISDCLGSSSSSSSSNPDFRTLMASNLNEKMAKIPTSIGIPLAVQQTTPALSTIEAQTSARPDRSEELRLKASLNIHASVSVVQVQKMQTWTPVLSTGVECTRAVEMNVPIVANVEANTKGTLKATLKTPAPRTRLFGFHSVPATFTRDFDSQKNQLLTPKVKVIRVPQLEQLQREIDETVGKHSIGMSFRAQGHVHKPANPTDYQQFLQLSMATENHFHLDYEPETDEEPKEIAFALESGAFGKSSTRGPSLDNFYSKMLQFDEVSNEEDFDLETHDQRKSKLNSFLSQFQATMYKHQLKMSVEMRGGRKHIKASVGGSASCDAKFKFCQMSINAQRTPMLARENIDWSFQSDLQILTPDAVSNVQQLNQQSQNAKKNHKLVVQVESAWGAEHKQSLNFRLQGEKAHSKNWIQQISQQYQGPLQKFQEKQSAFINKYDIVAEYKLGLQSQNVFRRLLDTIKSFGNFWNTNELYQDDGRDGQMRGSLIIDPITQQHANVTVKTPSKVVKMETVQLPMKVRPFPLVRPADKSIHNPTQLFHRMTANLGRAECSVDGKRVETFDNVQYSAPIGECYTVLAKDCSSQDQPQFAVLMKTIRGEKDKKIKIVNRDYLVECKPTKSSSEQKKLQCFVNGQPIDDDQQQQGNNIGPYGPVVEYNNDEKTDVTVNVEGVQVRFGCWGWNGCKQQKAWIKLSSKFKETQCGLCGNFDDQEEGEWKMANNQQARNIKEFHQSYSLGANQDDECSDQDSFYNQNFRQSQFGLSAEDEQNGFNLNQNEVENSDENEDDNQWQAGAYHSDESSSEEDQWGRQSRKMMLRKKKKSDGSKKEQRGSGEDNDEQNTEAPVQATKVIEYNHKVCFSLLSVKQCPPGSYPSEKSGSHSKKTQFVCLSRSDPQARRMQRQARAGVILDVSDHKPSFVESVKEPSRCVVY